MEIISHDILIVGGGAAGLRAAIAAAEKNPKLSIGLISKVYPVRSHTVSAEGGIAGVLRDYDSFEKHEYDTVKGGDYLADQDAVELFVREAPKEIIQLENWGCPWSREEDGSIAVRAFGGMSVKRTVFAADKTGFYMLHSLFERSLKYENIKRYDEFFVTKIFRDSASPGSDSDSDSDSSVTGVFALDLRHGKKIAFASSAIILATGGAGKIYKFTTNGNIKTGDGMALALRTGAALKDMEFVQFHPTGLLRTGILITEAARGEGGYLLNNKGERFMKDYLPSRMELGPRDIISRAIMQEIQKGNGFEGPYGSYVQLDLRHLGEKLIDQKLPLVRELAMEYANVDPVKEPIPVRPVAHYFMGGIHTNLYAATGIPGLFAAGECACITINGANRLGSNALAECLVFGRIAGEKAAESIESRSAKSVSRSDAEKAFVTLRLLALDEEKRLNNILQRHKQNPEKVSYLRDEMQHAMDEHAGIFREQKSLKQGLSKILALKERLRDVSLADQNELFNTEFTSLLELDFMLDVSHAVLVSALTREESRGSHTRTDFPNRDDEKFLHHLLIKRGGGGIMTVARNSVAITKYKPEERKY